MICFKICYIDPATTAIIFQVIAGILISFGIILGIWWKKISTFFKGLFIKGHKSGGKNKSARTAVILADSPTGGAAPEGLTGADGEIMIERQIEQLNDAGVRDITVVTGFLRERFEYLADKYGVKLVFNPEFETKSSLASVNCAVGGFNNTYLCRADDYFWENPFNKEESRSWCGCLYFQGKTNGWCVKADGNNKITEISAGGEDCYILAGPAYFSGEFSAKFMPLAKEFYAKSEAGDWEQVLRDNIQSLEIYLNNQADNMRKPEGVCDNESV